MTESKEVNREPDGEYHRLETTLPTHSTVFDKDYFISENDGSVLAGPITGSGSISGEGRLKVV